MDARNHKPGHDGHGGHDRHDGHGHASPRTNEARTAHDRTYHGRKARDRTPRDTDVIVVGAGPTGLLLAGDLAEAGLGVTLLERRPATISNLTRALAVHARTLEQLDARDLADELVAGGHRVPAIRLFGDATFDATRLRSRFPFVLITPQFEVERLLERRARRAGVVFRYDSEVLGLDQDADGVTMRFRTADGLGSIRAAYAVGTDGVRSTVREALGLPFPGKSVIRSLVLADVRLSREPASPFTVAANDDAFALVGSFGDGWYRVIGWNRHRQADDDAPVGLDEVHEFTRLALGSDDDVPEVRWVSRFHSDERQVPRYRVGRVFLAGDAAHVHSPAGGQGMNTGLQDAANLSWKLAAVLRGHSPDSLLDSYQTERHPVGRQVLRSSGALIRLALLHTAPGRAVRTLAARLVNHLRPLSGHAIRLVSGIGIAYPAGPGAHPLAGRRAPDIHLADGSRLYALLRQGTFVLLTPADEPGIPHTPPSKEDSPRPAAGRVITASWRSGRRTALLVRPDGYIAWATDATAPAARAAALRSALLHWTGAAPEDGDSIGTGRPASLTPPAHAADTPGDC